MNVQVFETIYYGALEASCELAERYGPYDSYQGSPVSQGVSSAPLFPKTELKFRVIMEARNLSTGLAVRYVGCNAFVAMELGRVEREN